ncbi:uncharacterized protein LOC108631283 [Ceratina calcarata]|uniref:Uncharacterized protein LOC108631283 n=1 Tax=Ceratina calcarata TaxID=156304 RepID=A0AAJ7JDY8_9HYME|nr:uncharacterized protein LOC108631283 [Ceratina calcarata]
MEFDFSFNFMLIFSIFLSILATIITVYQKLKLRWPVRMNCWFCNNDTKIWRQHLNWWMCPHCEQYNGFAKNGDYARTIPEQHRISRGEIKNYCRTINQQQRSNEHDEKSGLCERCNRNESLKLSKLSNYIPRDERNYEYEIKRFKDSLEEIYPLCVRCKATVKGVLCRQALWLAQYKMLFFKQKPFSAMIADREKRYSEPVCRIVSTILGSMAAYDMELVLLPFGGLLFQFYACWITSKSQRNSDRLLLCLWLCMIVLLPFKDKTILKEAELLADDSWFPFEYVTHYHMVTLIVTIIGFINIMPKSRKTEFKNMSFKKIESPTKNVIMPFNYTESTNNDENFSDKPSNRLNQPITNQLASNATKKYGYQPCSTNSISTTFQSPCTTRPRNLSLSLTTESNNGRSEDKNTATVAADNGTYSLLLNDSLSTLGELTLSSEERPRRVVKTPKIFETRVYDTNVSDLFKKSVVKSRHVLSPPKLKSVTQTSWVAGGYWQEGIDPPLSLSRSSSQSSGFGSVVSNFGTSKEPSIHEFDRCSIMSDATQSYRTVRQANSPVVGSSYQQSLHGPRFPETINNHQFNYQTMKRASANLSVSQTWNNSPFPIDQCPCPGQNGVNGSNTKDHPSEIKFPSHHATIVAGPVWLPALLCGSLVINIIVLCTTLSR